MKNRLEIDIEDPLWFKILRGSVIGMFLGVVFMAIAYLVI